MLDTATSGSLTNRPTQGQDLLLFPGSPYGLRLEYTEEDYPDTIPTVTAKLHRGSVELENALQPTVTLDDREWVVAFSPTQTEALRGVVYTLLVYHDGVARQLYRVESSFKSVANPGGMSLVVRDSGSSSVLVRVNEKGDPGNIGVTYVSESETGYIIRVSANLVVEEKEDSYILKL